MRVLFAGSPDVAVPTLRAIAESRHSLVGVLTQPARPVGRKRVTTDTAVAVVARELGVPLETPTSSEHVMAAVREWSPDIAIVVAYGRIVGEGERLLIPQGWWNVHFSLLPRWRGAAPVPYAIQEGETTTGLSIFRIEEGLDTGPIARSLSYAIAPHDTTHTVLTKLSHDAPREVIALLDAAEAGSLVTRAQEGDATYAPKPPGDIGVMRWSDTADRLYNRFRAWGGEPGCFAVRDDTEQRVNIIDLWPDPGSGGIEPGCLVAGADGVAVGTGTTALVLSTVQPAGKPVMGALDWLRGLPPGVRFRA